MTEIFDDRTLVLAGDDAQNLARVITQSKGIYRVHTAAGEKLAKVSGKFSYDAKNSISYPVVGDYVLLNDAEAEAGVIHTVLPRSSLFTRAAAGTGTNAQAVAANIDYALITMALNLDFNLRRLERYLTIAWDSGAVPVVVLTKADLCDNVDTKRREVETVAMGADVLVTSAMDGSGYDALAKYLSPHKTVALLGSSGVGKSTLINKLLGEELIKTNAVREGDDRGRHTTTTRNLIYLPNGAAVVDTPGMREVGVESGDVSSSFADVEALADQCKFGDCKHLAEPGCAVKAAIDSGELDEARFNSYNKLKIEIGYDGLNARQREVNKLERMMQGHGGMKGYRKIINKKKH